MSKFVKANGPFLKYSNFERSKPVFGFHLGEFPVLQGEGDDNPGLPFVGDSGTEIPFVETGFLLPPKILIVNTGLVGELGPSVTAVPFINSLFTALNELKAEFDLESKKNNFISGFPRYYEQPDVFSPELYQNNFGSHQAIATPFDESFVFPGIPVEDGFFAADILYITIKDRPLYYEDLEPLGLTASIDLAVSKFKERYDRFYKIKCVTYLSSTSPFVEDPGEDEIRRAFTDQKLIDIAATLFEYNFEYRGIFDATGCFTPDSGVRFSRTAVDKIKELVTLEAANFFD